MKKNFLLSMGFTLGLFFVFPSVGQALSLVPTYCEVTTTQGVSFTRYENVAFDSDLCKAMNYLNQRQIMAQFGTSVTANGNFLSGDLTNRAQAMAVVLNAFDPEAAKIDIGNPPYGSALGFTDTPANDRQWWYAYALRAKQLGFINGNADGTVRGGNNVTRAEFIKMFLAASPNKQDINGLDAFTYRYLYTDLQTNYTAWYAKYVEFIGLRAQLRKAFEGSRCPTDNICQSLPTTTNEMALLMYYYHLWTGKDLGYKTNPSPTPTPPSPSPNLSVPVLESPANASNFYNSNFNGSSKLIFSWSPATNAVKYDLMLRFGGNAHYSLIYSTTKTNYGVASSALPPLTGVGYVQISWKVRAVDISGNFKDSLEWNLKNNWQGSLSPAIPISPINNFVFNNPCTKGDIKFIWTAVPAAVKYIVYVNNTNSAVTAETSGTEYTFQTKTSQKEGFADFDNGTRTWWVRAFDVNGNYMDSVHLNFQVNNLLCT